MLSDRLREVTLDCQHCHGHGPPDCPECKGAGEIRSVQGNLILAYLAGADDLRQLLTRVQAQARLLEQGEKQRNRIGDRMAESRLAHFRAGLVLMAQAVDAILERNTWQQHELVRRAVRRK